MFCSKKNLKMEFYLLFLDAIDVLFLKMNTSNLFDIFDTGIHIGGFYLLSWLNLFMFPNTNCEICVANKFPTKWYE